MSYVTGVGMTPFGRLPGRSTFDLMSEAATLAIRDAELERREVDGILCGYVTSMPHMMLATLFAQHFGLKPQYAHAVTVGGASVLAMMMLAHAVTEAGLARNVLVVAGENRLSGQSRDSTVNALVSEVGNSTYEVPFGGTIPAYYALVAARYMHEYGIAEETMAELAVLMRRHAAEHPGAHLTAPLTVADVMASRPIATPLKFLDCCPVSDGAAAFIVSAEPTNRHAVRIRGCGQAHTHQHVSAAPSLVEFGAKDSVGRASARCGIAPQDVRYLSIYDSFTITLALLLEEIGLAPRGQAGVLAREGHFSRGGALPLNTHGGLLSYGHCGAGGAFAHVVETQQQMTGRAGPRQVADASLTLMHADGGILSSHATIFLERVR